MKSRYRLIALLVLVVSIVIAVVLVNARPSSQQNEITTQPPQTMPAVEATLGSHQSSLKTTGRVSSQTDIQLIAQASGRIESVQPIYREGATFKAGDVLLSIDKRDYENSLAQARSSLASAEQQLATENGLALQARREWRDLGNDEANALFLREPQLKAAEQQVEAAIANVAQAELNLARTDIVAPFDGVIRTRIATLGQFVGTGNPVAEIIATNALQVRVSLSQQQVDSLGWSNGADEASGSAAIVQPPQHLSASAVNATVRHLSPLIDPMSQLIEVILDIPESSSGMDVANLQSGQFVEVELFGQAVPNSIWVPERALYERDKLLVDNSGKLNIVPISIHASKAGELLVSGISDGDLVITDRPLWVFEGQTVEAVVENTEASSARPSPETQAPQG